MIDVEPLIVSELDALLPLPDGGRADWADVTRRAGNSSRSRPPRRGVLAAMLVAATVGSTVAATTPVRAAIARSFGGFSAWISGEPGTPASSAEQQVFQRQNERTWSDFAPPTQLRRLIQTNAGGSSYTLYGFRSGDELCLRLVASGAVDATSSHCAPLQALESAKQPALVVTADEPLGSSGTATAESGYVPDSASATFGIASDGIAQIVVQADDGAHDALVASNAFLYIADHPKLGTRVRSVEAIAGDGAKTTLPFQSAPFGTTDLPKPPSGTPQGPTQVERQANGGTINWVEQLESRGQAISAVELNQLAPFYQHYGKPVLTRLIQPDPNDSLRVGVMVFSPSGSITDPNATLCQMLFDQRAVSAGCSPLRDFFPHRQINPGLSTPSGGDQFTILSGLVTDNVASITVFLASGQTVEVPLKDNAYLARISRAAFPIRIVGYDNHGNVIDIETLKSAD